MANIIKAVLVLLWELSCRVFHVPEYIIPAPSQIVYQMWINRYLLVDHTMTTSFVALLGLAFAIPSGILIALLMDLSLRLKNILYPFLVISQTIPIVFIYPLLLIWFGFGLSPKVIVVFLVCFFPIAVNVYKGFQHTSEELLDLLRSMNASTWYLYTKVKWPGSLPDFMSGLKITLTYSLMGAVIGEWLGASKGLGVYMIRSYKTFNTAGVFAAISIIVIMTLVLFKIVEIFEHRFLAWKYINKE
ncbi:ABC transporter permease [Spirochaeta cellobiosiphila]|uniref:ABC transporter permease n=1 Tax=Spirochaeta cellobiosiphila TaxID=504483 RepID=UPI0009FCCC8F|nr:ABC transporter permease [Spirochaeta cellobiosiphila]